MTIAAPQTATMLPSSDLATAIAGVQAATEQLSSVLTALQGQLGTGADTGAATLAGGPTSAGQSGCSCSGAMGALEGADQIGQAPPVAAPDVAGADAAPQAAKADKAATSAKTEKADTAGGGGSLGEKMVAEAKKYLGKPYVYAAAGPDSFDCSGLVLYVAKKFGIDLEHKASIQATKGTAVDKGDLKPGDLVYFSDGGEVSHIGIYAGDGKYIHAPKPGDVVKISDLGDSWASQHYSGARRLG